MPERVEEAMEWGAVGCSSGLCYEPAAAASTEEVIEVFEPLRRHGGEAHPDLKGDP